MGLSFNACTLFIITPKLGASCIPEALREYDTENHTEKSE